jgi:hypothetical protein
MGCDCIDEEMKKVNENMKIPLMTYLPDLSERRFYRVIYLKDRLES